jgi:hypothetical protein
VLRASSKTARVEQGDKVRLTFSVRNLTGDALRSTVSARPATALRASGRTNVTVRSLRPGATRKLSFTLRIGSRAKIGTHKVRVSMTIGGRTVTKTVKVRVVRD